MKDIFDIVTRGLVWILSIILAYMLVLKLTGHSPTSDTVFGIALTVIGTALVNVIYRFGRFEANLANLSSQFSALAKDFKSHAKRK